MHFRRWPRFTYHYKLVLMLLLSCLFFVVYLLIHWGIMCTNLEAWRHVSTVCNTHSNGEALGILCGPLCSEKGIHSLVCEALHAGKEAVFSAHWEATRLVFKASRTKTPAEQFESLFWVDSLGTRHYPNEEEFSTMIKDLIINKLNITVTNYQLQRLGRLRTHRMETDPEKRNLEMENVWPLLQNNEYLMTILYEDRDVFPQLIGTCGTFYAVEYVRPIETPTTILALSDSKAEWAKRLKLAVMILDLLDEFDNNFQEPFHLCDVKINHFGLPLGGQRLKFLDLDAVYPKSIISRITGDNRACEKHEDCDYFDCRSLCSKNKKCESPVVNDNLQIICEKIFLGWTLSGKIIIPGLLMSDHTTSSLAVLLRQCASPMGESTRLPRAAVSNEVKSRLHHILNEMERELAASFQ